MATKADLTTRRSLLIEAHDKATDTKTRMELQQQLTQVNADLKYLNKLEAAEAKRTADLKKALGRKEAEANEERREERETRFASSAVALDEELYYRARQLQRTIEHARRRSTTPLPEHQAKMFDTVTNFVEAQRGHLKQLRDAEAARDAKWRDAWKDDAGGQADDNA